MPIGHMECYDPEKCKWEQYIQRFEFYFAANSITDDKLKRATFLSSCGSEIFALCHSLVAPAKLDTVDFSSLTSKLMAHFAPKDSYIIRRFKFRKRVQGPHESISSFVAALRTLAEGCKFSNLEEELRDQMVVGIVDERLQQQLLENQKLTFKVAMETALAFETAKKEVSQLKTTDNSGEVLAVRQQQQTVRKPAPATNTARERPGNTAINRECFRCTEKHSPDTCWAANVNCHYCGKEGHLEKACFAKKKNLPRKATSQSKANTHMVENEEEAMYELNYVNGRRKPFMVDLKINNKPLRMQLDTGCSDTIISEATWRELNRTGQIILEPSEIMLTTWTHEQVRVLGVATVTVEFQRCRKQLRILVGEGGVSLLGRNWMEALGMHIAGVNKLEIRQHSPEGLRQQLVQEFPEVFDGKMEGHKGPTVNIRLKEGCSPKFMKYRQVPWALKPQVEAELDKLVQQGVLTPIQHSKWATPIVTVVKPNKEVRICGDYRSTVNQAVLPSAYPLPTIEEMRTCFTGGRVFSKIDLAQAYQQLRVDDNTSEILTLNTTKGLFRVNRLQYGVSSCSQIFQKFLENLLQGIPGIIIFIDDVGISGKDKSEHDRRLRAVLQRLQSAGLRVNLQKCKFEQPSIQCLGFSVDSTGWHPMEDKVRAIKEAKRPQDRAALRAFIGALTFYDCFLKNRATVMKPLYELANSKGSFDWGPRHTKAFVEAKKLLASEAVVGHYDPKLPLRLSVDASGIGVGIVLANVLPDGTEVPIAFASKTLSKAEQNYSVLDREGLAVIFGVKRFHSYLYGRSFSITTDHKPLIGLFNPDKAIPHIQSPRIIRWCLMLSNYDYVILYRRGPMNQNADMLSRLPVDEQFQDPPPLREVLLLEGQDGPPLDPKDISEATKKDKLLQKVLFALQNGWTHSDDSQFEPFLRRRTELSTHRDCILWGNRVVIPESLRDRVLQLLHSNHPGICAMKACARSYVWWPGLDTEIEEKVRGCNTCQQVRNMPPKDRTSQWESEDSPWSRLHVDIAGPCQGGKYFLIVVDSYSKWLEVEVLSHITSTVIIAKLRRLFATHGIPRTIVSDQGTQFVSEEILSFYKNNGIKGLAVPPGHPSSNGRAERQVQVTKQNLRLLSAEDISTRLARLLLKQHTTPSAGTGKTPAELLYNRKLRTALSVLHPKTERGKDQITAPHREFAEEQAVFVRNLRDGDKWLPGVVRLRKGQYVYEVDLLNGQQMLRHVDQIRRRDVPDDSYRDSSPTRDNTPVLWHKSSLGDQVEVTQAEEAEESSAESGAEQGRGEPTTDGDSRQEGGPIRSTRAGRVIRPPERFRN